MAGTTNNPSEIARETLRLLAIRKIPPTPDNYLTLYHEISGTPLEEKSFPEKQLSAIVTALSKASPEQTRLTRTLDEAVKNQSWDIFRTQLINFIQGLSDTQKLSWGTLINDLIIQVESKHIGLTPARKRESLQHILSSSNANPEILFTRLQSLLKNWGEGKLLTTKEPEPEDQLCHADLSETPHSETYTAIREILIFLIEAIAIPLFKESPKLLEEAQSISKQIKIASNRDDFSVIFGKAKRLAFKTEIYKEDQIELQKSLISLFQLLVSNIGELVLDDHWLNGQIDIIKEIIESPLSQNSIDDAQRRFKDVIIKQSHLKNDLKHARETIKEMLAGFVDQLADFADATTDYHNKIEIYAEKISKTDDISTLSNVLSEVMRETKAIQHNAQHSRDELRSTQEKVRQAEARIRQLEEELEQSSQLVRHDQLTGVLNRRGLEEVFDKEIARADRHETALCVGLLDIDNFKRLNDAMGHDIGDQALVHLARTCRDCLRPQDTVARYGGEEFVLILPETPLEEAVVALTRLQRELTRKFFMHDNEKILITFSAGLTEFQSDDTRDSVIKRADEAMYEAKKTGKNRVITK